MLLSRHQNAGQNNDIKIANGCFENVTSFRYLGRTVTNQNLIQEEVKRNTFRILAGKPEGKIPLGKPRRRWVDNIKMDLRETGWGGMNSMDRLRIGTRGGLL
jgi:hypothetical protein